MSAAVQVQRCPCLCGCPCHLGTACRCGCKVYAPNYVAGASARGDVMTPRHIEELTQQQAAVARQLGYRPPSGQDLRSKVRCLYCGGQFLAVAERGGRRLARTCSPACRKAWSVALAYEDDVDVPPGSVRRATFSRERAEATGFGLVTAGDGTRYDLRARRWSRWFGARARPNP